MVWCPLIREWDRAPAGAVVEHVADDVAPDDHLGLAHVATVDVDRKVDQFLVVPTRDAARE